MNKTKSIFLENLHHAYAQTDGSYAFPNSREGDMLKQAKREIEALRGWLYHIMIETVDGEDDSPAFARDMCRRALSEHGE